MFLVTTLVAVVLVKLVRSLSRRERQIMDILHRSGEASVTQVLVQLPEPPSYSAVRALLRILEEKGHVTHDTHERRFIYTPTSRRSTTGLAQLHHVVRTFYRASTTETIAVLLAHPLKPFTEFEIKRLRGLIRALPRPGPRVAS